MAQSTPHIHEDLLDQYAMATLPEGLIADVEEHLLTCSLCQRRLVQADEFVAVFRAAAAELETKPVQHRIRSLRLRIIACAGASVALTFLLVFLSLGERRNFRLPPAVLLMQSFRGPEAAAHMVSGRRYSLVFDLPIQAAAGYQVEVVNDVGTGIVRTGAEVKDGRLATVLEGLARGSYWVRVYRTRPDRQVVAEYGLRAD
jgi:anti-sigma factor RsiW